MVRYNYHVSGSELLEAVSIQECFGGHIRLRFEHYLKFLFINELNSRLQNCILT